MRGIADDRMECEILARVEEGPVAIEALASAAVAVAPHAIGGREGGVHAILHHLVREGHVHVVRRSPSGGAIYAKSAKTDVDAEWSLRDAAPIPPPVDASESRVALLVASRVRDPEDRGRVVADVLAHRAALAAAGRLRDFGPPKAARDALGRVDRGRFVIVAPDSPWERIVRVVRHEGPSILVTLAVLALLWVYVAEFRVVPSNSMQPGIKPGDRLLNLKWDAHSVPDRYDVLVFRRPDGLVLVKRVVGLPGERIAIDSGDLLIDGVVATKPDALREAMREPLLRAQFDARGKADGWSTDADGWRTYTGTLFADEPRFVNPETGRLELVTEPPRARAHDVYVSAVARRDAAVRVRFVDGDGRLASAGVGEILLTRDREGIVRLEFGSPDGAARGQGGPYGFASGRDGGDAEAALSLSIVDGVLRVHAGDHVGTGSIRSRRLVRDSHAEVAVRGAVTSVAIDRDIHYTQPPSAQFATDAETPYVVPQGSVFFLGDHSAYSRDSRFQEVGAIPLDRVLGRVVFRIWPPSRVGLVR